MYIWKLQTFRGEYYKQIIAWFLHDVWHKYHSWHFKIVSNFTRLTVREITYNNFEISLVVYLMKLNKYLFNTVNNKECRRGQQSVVWLKRGQPCLHHLHVLSTVFSWQPFSSFNLWSFFYPHPSPLYSSTVKSVWQVPGSIGIVAHGWRAWVCQP